jgi:hypothetical protein
MLRASLVSVALVFPAALVSPHPCRSAPPDRSPAAGESTLLNEHLVQRRLAAQVIEREVEAALHQAQQSLAENPAGVRQELKMLLHQVQAAGDLEPAQRDALRQRLETAVREAARREADFERRQLRVHEAHAAAQDRDRVAADLERREQRVKQLVERFDSLLAEARYGLAEVVANQLENDARPITASVQQNVRLASATRDALSAKINRQQGVVRALEQVELAGVVMPGDEPIVYPQAERWQELTARRAKYARTELSQPTPAEAKLAKALAEPTNFEFVETSLADVVDYLKDLHGIEIQFDQKALETVGVELDTPITRRLSGISLRSALRLLLGALDLTYTIQNEVLLITTPEEASHRLITKVYPVGELVLPISTPNFSGGFGQLGGFNNGQNRGGPMTGNGNFMPFGQNQNNGIGQGVF